MLTASGRGWAGFDTIPGAAGEDAQSPRGMALSWGRLGGRRVEGPSAFHARLLGGLRVEPRAPGLPPACCRWEWVGPRAAAGAVPCQGQVSWCPQGLQDLLEGKFPFPIPSLCMSPLHDISQGPQTVELGSRNDPRTLPSPKMSPFPEDISAVPPVAQPGPCSAHLPLSQSPSRLLCPAVTSPLCTLQFWGLFMLTILCFCPCSLRKIQRYCTLRRLLGGCWVAAGACCFLGRGEAAGGWHNPIPHSPPALSPRSFIPSSFPVEEAFLGSRQERPGSADPPVCVPSMGVRVMDTSWVARRGPSAGRKASSAPPSAQPPAPPAELPPTPHSPIPEQPPDSSATPSTPPISFGFPPAAERTR